MVDAIQNGRCVSCNDSIFGSIIANCLLLVSDIPRGKVFFVKRSTNQVAHLLAKTSVSMFGLGKRFSVSPNFIDDIILLDFIKYMD